MIDRGEVHTMDAVENTEAQWLSRTQIDSVIESMSAADLVDAMSKHDAEKESLQMAMLAFDTAAARSGLSNGTPATQHVKVGDLKYLGERIKGAINVDSPLSEGQEL